MRNYIKVTLLKKLYKKSYLTLFLFLLNLIIFCFAANAIPSEKESEAQLLSMLNSVRAKYNLPLFKSDPKLSAVCRSHSMDMRDNNFFSLTSPSRGDLTYQMKKYGIYEQTGPIHIFMDSNLDSVIKSVVSKKDFYYPFLNYVGIGVVKGRRSNSDVLFGTVISIERVLKLDRIPSTASVDQQIAITGKLFPDFADPVLPVTYPDGHVERIENQSPDPDSFLFYFDFNGGKGKYNLEVVVHQKGRGPKVATIMPVYVGMQYPPPPKAKNVKKEKFKNVAEMEKYMIGLVNKDRATANLKPLIYDALLTKVGRLHSQDMAKNNFFAHVNPRGEDPTARFNKAGGLGSIAENIASGISIAESEDRLMESPGHRANILNKDVTHIGIGIYYYDQMYYITQQFQKKISPINTWNATENLFAWINNKRDENNLSKLKWNVVIGKAALEHSKAMAINGTVDQVAGGVYFYDRYIKDGGIQNIGMTAAFYLDESLNSIKEKLEKETNLIFDENAIAVGIGIYQGSHKKYGENLLWLTIGIQK